MQHQRHVAQMLPTTTATTTSPLLNIATTMLWLLLLLLANTTRTTSNVAAAAATYATPVASATTAAGQAIGATSLAAVAAAAESMVSSHSDDIINAQSANLLLEELQHPGHMVNLTRQHDGDVFRTSGVNSCNMDTCVGLSSGTAALLQPGGAANKNDILLGHATAIGTLAGGGAVDQQAAYKRKKTATAVGDVGNNCDCRCLPYLSTYREDLGICVDDIHECILSPFVSGSSSEKIPFVFLPLRGQIIYPSREISFPDIRTPVCAVTGAQYLTTNGWSDLRNPIDTDYPFRMFRDEGRTFLQWLGEPELRQKMQGRLIVVHLVCRDMMLSLNATAAKDHRLLPKNVFSPCVAFRVNGSPVKYLHNVSEVLFQAEATSTLASTSDGMSTKEYVVIGVCSLLLGLIYVSSVFLYLHVKKRKQRDQSHLRSSLDDLANEINYPKNDQVTFGAPFHRSGSLYSATSLATTSAINEARSRASISSAVGVHLKEEMGIVKNNPLLQHFPQLSEMHASGNGGGFASDISNSNSECETDSGGAGAGGSTSVGGASCFHDKLKQLQTSALVHPTSAANASMANVTPYGGDSSSQRNDSESTDERSSSPTQETECLPEENVAIVEDMMTEEKLEQMRAMVNGNIRKKLYFNPAYFEPHLLAQPPPAAVEFLTKIREVIAIAKYKMATKRYQPSLVVIPEEGAMRSTTPSLYSSQLQMSGNDGCQGCANNRCSGHVKNCGDKRNSIEKWLQTVPLSDENKTGAAGKQQQHQQEQQNRKSTQAHEHDEREKSPAASSSSARKDIVAPKQRPPPPPTPASDSRTNDTPSPPRPHVIKIRHNNNSSNTYDPTATNIIVQPALNNGNHGGTSRNYDAYSALSAAANIYGFAEMGSEIYNNPKFTLHDSPTVSRSSSHRSKCSRTKRLEALDQYAAASTPTSLTSADREHYEMLRNMKQMPDMAYDSITARHSYPLDIPTPDYDSTMEKRVKDIYSNTTQSSAPSVPTPDYSTLSKKSRNSQPDSPIYRRKSPQYLIVDYDTDSLERIAAAKRKSSHSSASPSSSDVSSQLSPSLSTALPLEEELEISHAVYDKVNGFRKDGNVKKKMATAAKSEQRRKEKLKEMEARIKYDTPFLGSMTIEVAHEPPSDIELSTDSEHYDPDTLDRKPKQQQHSFCDVSPAWQEHIAKAQHFVNHGALSDSEGLQALPTFGRQTLTSMTTSPVRETRQLSASQLRSQRESHTLRDNGEPCQHQRAAKQQVAAEPLRSSFESLRQIYQSQLVRQGSQCDSQTSNSSRQSIPESVKISADTDEQGRLLTLEAKHTRRQRLMATPSVETVLVEQNKTTIKIKTPTLNRPPPPAPPPKPTASCKPEPEAKQINNDWSKNCWDSNDPVTAVNCRNSSTQNNVTSCKPQCPVTPPAPPPSSASTTLTSQRSNASSQRQPQHTLQHQYPTRLPSNQSPFLKRHLALTNGMEEETASNHSESTEITGVSDTQANSEFDCSCNNTLSSAILKSESSSTKEQSNESPNVIKKLTDTAHDYGDLYNTPYNGLRGDYSLNKYLNRRKSQETLEEQITTTTVTTNCSDSKIEANNNLKNADLSDSNRFDVISVSSRSNRSSSRLSDRTKEMYRNSGVPVGIAYPQRNNAPSANTNGSTITATSNTTTNTTSNVQTVYRCEIEPVQLTHGMQIAMGLKDRAKKAKDLKNAWKKFVSMAAAKFSPTASPAPPFEKKSSASFLEALERDEGISSLIDEQQLQQASTPQSSYSAPASQNYYEQRFGTARLQEMDSGYMSADSNEMYKRSFYDRYNFRLMAGRDRVIRVDTITDNSDGGSTPTPVKHTAKADGGVLNGKRTNGILDSNRFEDFEHMGEPPPLEGSIVGLEGLDVVSLGDGDECSDADSDRTLTRSNDNRRSPQVEASINLYSSEDEQGAMSYGSSETDGETTVEDMWESGAESIETHSVLYKNVRKN